VNESSPSCPRGGLGDILSKSYAQIQILCGEGRFTRNLRPSSPDCLLSILCTLLLIVCYLRVFCTICGISKNMQQHQHSHVLVELNSAQLSPLHTKKWKHSATCNSPPLHLHLEVKPLPQCVPLQTASCHPTHT
jgi:hypothetical protein